MKVKRKRSRWIFQEKVNFRKKLLKIAENPALKAELKNK